MKIYFTAMANPPRFPATSRETIKIYNGVRVRVTRKPPHYHPRRSIANNNEKIAYSRGRKFHDDRDTIWQAIKVYHGSRDAFDALGGYRRLESKKDDLLRELKTYFPVYYPNVVTTRVDQEQDDKLGELLSLMPHLVIDKIKFFHRVSMISTKSAVNSEIKKIAFIN